MKDNVIVEKYKSISTLRRISKMKINTKFNKKLLAVMSIATLANIAPLVPSNGIATNLALVEVQASSETNENDIEAIKQSMLDATPIIESQFMQIPEEAWLEYSNRVSNEGGDPSTVYDWALEDYPIAFEPAIAHYRKSMVESYNLDEDSLNTVSHRDLLWLEYQTWLNAGGQEDLSALATGLVEEYGVEYADESEDDRLANLKETMIGATPVTSEQFDAIPAEDWLAYADEVNESGGDPSTVYNRAVEDFPEVFEETLNNIRGTLVSEYSLNEESLNEVSDIDLLWLEYSVWIESGNTEDFTRLTERLIDEHGVILDEEAPGETDLERIRTVMIETTPITPEQFDAISETTWIAYTDQINEEGGDPSTAFNWALRDYPEVFQDTIAYIRGELINRYNLEEASLTERVTDQELLWEEYSVWLQNGEENLEELSYVLVQEYGVRTTSSSIPDDNEEDPAPTLPNTGESRTSYSSYIIVAVVGLLGAVILLRDYFVNKKDA